MADFDAPSFSLGFDFDLFDSDPQIAPANEHNKAPSTSNQFSEASTILEDNDNDFETLTVVDSDSDNQVSPPKLKRLRRGSTAENTKSASINSKVDLQFPVIVDDDDIEDFSSPEDNRTDEHFSTQHRSVCNSSKFPLNGHGVLTKQSGKRKQNISDAPESVITNCNKQPFPKLTISPLRRFQLIDSDSDSDYPLISQPATKKPYNESKSSINEQKNINSSINTSIKKDLWEDFRPVKSSHIPTPAFDEFCEEYFSSMKDKDTNKNKCQSNEKIHQNNHVTNNVIDLCDPRPPAHQYFFHDDLRVQNLVRARLPNFFPLDAEYRDSEQPSTSNIDYIGQFSNAEKGKKGSGNNIAETSSRKNPRKSKIKEKTEKGIPKDAGRRRVQADGKAAGSGSGHWFTNSDGKRVYVSKNGQEHSGRAAYMLYKKESGGFRNKRAKKTSTNAKSLFGIS